MSNTLVVRLRWFDPEPEGPSTPIDWHFPALITATLFLNFPFWYMHGLDLPMYFPLPLYAALVGAGVLVLTGIFFLGPALAVQASRRPLLNAIENSFGSIPALGVRLCCVLFLALWVANLVAAPGLWWLSDILRRDVSSAETGFVAAAVVAFLFITGFHGLRTSAKLALFSNKLGAAILVAAMLRVHAGWPSALDGFPPPLAPRLVSQMLQGFSRLGFYLAPLAILAADFGYRSHGQKQVAMTGFMGITLPLFVTTLFVGVMNVATVASPIYQPSLSPTVAMALWAHAARSALPARMMVAMITVFGAGRFGARALERFASIPTFGKVLNRGILVGLVGATVWVTFHQDTPGISAAFEVSSTCLAVAAAILTADVVTGMTRVERLPKRVDLVALIALAAGAATPWYLPRWILVTTAEPWWHPWLLPSYGVGFLVCLCGRIAERLASARTHP